MLKSMPMKRCKLFRSVEATIFQSSMKGELIYIFSLVILSAHSASVVYFSEPQKAQKQ